MILKSIHIIHLQKNTYYIDVEYIDPNNTLSTIQRYCRGASYTLIEDILKIIKSEGEQNVTKSS